MENILHNFKDISTLTCKFRFVKNKTFILTLIFYLYSGISAFGSEIINQTQVISFIGHLNFDCLEDTITSKRINDRFLLPIEIHWGKGDSLKCGMFHADTVIVPKTEIVYPDNFLSGSFSAILVNNDLITDMIFSIRISDTISTRYVIYGQNALDMVDSIKLAQITENQSMPYFATILKDGNGLKNPDFRDPGSQLSYEFDQINLNLNPNNPPIVASDRDDDLKSTLKFSVFPNPAITALFYKVEGNTQDGLGITISSILSNPLVKIEIDSKSQPEISGQIDISCFASGIYYVSLEKNKFLITSKPIVILK